MKVYPVIHYLSDKLTVEQASIACQEGADGVFLISHHHDDTPLASLAATIKNKFGFKVGINYLSSGAVLAIEDAKIYNLDMVWSDTCGISSKGYTNRAYQIKESLPVGVQFFASIAFKYQMHEDNPSLAAQKVRDFSSQFIPTTSGAATGSAPSVIKISSMGPVAVASGMTEDNIEEFKPYLSHVLVATGVSIDEHHLCPHKLRTFIEKCKK